MPSPTVRPAAENATGGRTGTAQVEPGLAGALHDPHHNLLAWRQRTTMPGARE
jgi:hypothetical protein